MIFIIYFIKSNVNYIQPQGSTPSPSQWQFLGAHRYTKISGHDNRRPHDHLSSHICTASVLVLWILRHHEVQGCGGFTSYDTRLEMCLAYSLRVMTTCSLVGAYWSSGGTFHLHFPTWRDLFPPKHWYQLTTLIQCHKPECEKHCVFHK